LSDFGTRDGAEVFAGTGDRCHGWEMSCGDGGPAREARLRGPKGIAVGPQGTVYLADGKVIRQISSDGIISNYIGLAEPVGCAPPGCPDEISGEVPRDQAYFNWPTDIVVKQDDETLLITDNNVLLEVTRNGRVRLSAGRSPYVRPTLSRAQVAAQTADDIFVPKKATSVDLKSIHGLAIKRDGTIFFSETNQRDVNRIRLLTTNRRLLLFAGRDPGCDCTRYNCIRSCYSGDGGPAIAATFYYPSALTLNVQGDTLFIADQANVRVRAVQVSLPSSSKSGFYAIPATDGQEIYTFDVSGRHVSTLWTPTNEIIYTFQYDDYTTGRGTQGLLTSVTDAYNTTVIVERDDDGKPTALVAPFGLRSKLKTNADRYLSAFTDADGYSTQFQYDGANGLLTRMEDPSGLVHRFGYNANGRLVKDSRPDGGYLKLQVEQRRLGRLVTTSTRSGRKSTLLTTSTGDQTTTTATGPTGERVVNNVYGNGTSIFIYPDGSRLQVEEAPHPIWGEQIKVINQETIRLPSGLSKNLKVQYTAKLKDSSNPLSATEFSHTLKVNDVDFVTVKNTVQDRTESTTYSQLTLESVVTYDRFNQPVMSVIKNGGLSPLYTHYNKDGLKERTVQGTINVKYEYDSLGRLVRKILPGGGIMSYSYEDGELVRNLTVPSGRTYGFGYDQSGSVNTIVMPNGAQHRLSERVSPGNVSSFYSAPGQTFSYAKDFNSDGDLVLTRFPSGTREVRHYVDDGGRVKGLRYDSTNIDFHYGDETRRVQTVTRTEAAVPSETVDISISIAGSDGDLQGSTTLTPLSSVVTYTYDGPFMTSQRQESADRRGNAISVSFRYQMDNRFRLTKQSVSVDGTSGPSFDVTYDNGDRATKLGPFTVTRKKLTEVTMSDNTLQLVLKFDSNNRMMEKTVTVRNVKVFSATFQYDNGSRIIIKKVQAGSSSSLQTYGYDYDVDGQVTGVRLDGRLVEWYSYDSNGNRVAWQTDGKSNRTAEYDLQDRLTRVDSTPYVIDEDGFLVRKRAQKFEYSSKGELMKVRSLSDDVLAQYGYDGLGRRIAAIDSVGRTTRYIYGDLSNTFRITHTYDDIDGLTTLYYDVNGAPMAYDRGGKRYYVCTDHIGTPFLIVDGAGKILKTVRHSVYGVRLYDANPAQDLPLSFAGGVRETATAHLYFSFRDYDPEIGRWTSRDPSLYSGEQPNLYQYVLNDPVNFIDPLGLFCIGGSVKLLVGLGAQLCFDSGGISICGKAGVGIGGGFELDVLGEPSKTKLEAYGEAKATAGVPGASAGVEATTSYQPFKPDPCKFDWDVKGGVNTALGGAEYSLKKNKIEKKAGWFSSKEEKDGGSGGKKGGGKKGAGSLKLKAEAGAGIKACLGTG
jgi:RHS repeat-associated protein